MCKFKIVFFFSSTLGFYKSCRITSGMIVLFLFCFFSCRKLFEATGRVKKKQSGFFTSFSEKAVWWLKAQTAKWETGNGAMRVWKLKFVSCPWDKPHWDIWLSTISVRSEILPRGCLDMYQVPVFKLRLLLSHRYFSSEFPNNAECNTHMVRACRHGM